jgi:hypothetical protein
MPDTSPNTRQRSPEFQAAIDAVKSAATNEITRINEKREELVNDMKNNAEDWLYAMILGDLHKANQCVMLIAKAGKLMAEHTQHWATKSDEGAQR